MDENKNVNNNNNSDGFDSIIRGYSETSEDSFYDGQKIPEPTVENEENNNFLNAVIPDMQNDGYFENNIGYVAQRKPKRPKKEKTKKIGAGLVAICVVLAIVLGALSGAGAVIFINYKNASGIDGNISNDDKQIINTTINVDKVSDSVIEAVAEKASPSVVGIRTTMAVNNFFGGSEDYTSGEGSGIIYSSDGYIITNYHVLENAIKTSAASRVEVFLNEDGADPYNASLIGYNISYDLAVIKIDKTGLPAVELGNSDELKRGQFVAAIGCPGGLDFMGSVSYGIISGLNRTVSAASDEAVELIQTDAAINPGNSGGALLNIKGELIGVNSSKISATEYEGMGFAIPINTVKKICDQIISKKDEPSPYVGITLSEIYDETTLNRLGYPSGAVVSAVTSDGPAHSSGIRRGDIITEFNGKKISNYNDYYDAISNCSSGDVVSLKFYRAGRYYTVDITVSSNNSK